MQHIDAAQALDGASWVEQRALVLSKLAENTNALNDLRTGMQQMAVAHSTAIARLEVKAGMFGLLGGLLGVLVPLCIAVLVWFVKK